MLNIYRQRIDQSEWRESEDENHILREKQQQPYPFPKTQESGRAYFNANALVLLYSQEFGSRNGVKSRKEEELK